GDGVLNVVRPIRIASVVLHDGGNLVQVQRYQRLDRGPGGVLRKAANDLVRQLAPAIELGVRAAVTGPVNAAQQSLQGVGGCRAAGIHPTAAQALLALFTAPTR